MEMIYVPLMWLQQVAVALSSLIENLMPAQVEDVLDIEELMSFVSEK
jgi:hypothetical protein